MCNCTVQSASFGERLSLLDNIPLGWLLLSYNFDFVEWKYLLFIVHSECGCCFSFCFTLVTGFSYELELIVVCLFVGLFAFRSVWFQSRDFVKFKIKGVKWRYVRFLDFDLAAVVWYSTITSSGHLFGFGLIRGIQRYSNFQLFWLL